jgi:hypothetical protein
MVAPKNIMVNYLYLMCDANNNDNGIVFHAEATT